ncbi:CWC16 protein [Lyophyllum atratum]|nr:CWC16 protein [Lyophyllum atratum]
MQGFNKYYPPDYDPSHGSLNTYRGKHALGDRARKIDQGILITRFELPFNIWCGTCNNHIGMGVRYNAEKKKIGNYYSTPIFSFRCKCHLCDGWFEIQTDPKNTRYVVVSGARQKDEDWNPEENGGFAVHDTEGAAAPVDPLAALEKTTNAQNHLTNVQAPRLESLQSLSEQYNADPYALSNKVRKRFREVKKVEKRKQRADDHIKGRYGLPASLSLLEEDEVSRNEAKEKWAHAQREVAAEESNKLAVDIVSIPSSSSKATQPQRRKSTSRNPPPKNPIDSLRARILENTARQTNPFKSQLTGSKDDSRILVRK